MPQLKVTWTMTEIIEVPIKDFSLTAVEIRKKADTLQESVAAVGCDESDAKWVTEPKAKGSKNEPPEDFYFETSAGLFATNRHIAVKNNFPFRPNYTIGGAHWMKPIKDPRAYEDFEKILAADFKALPAHSGWFSRLYAPLLKLGLDVRGENETSAGYLLLKGELVGVLMPLNRQGLPSEKSFQFPCLGARQK